MACTSYKIQIDEEQRKLLVRAMQAALLNSDFCKQLVMEPVAAVYPDNQLEALGCLLEMTIQIEHEVDPELLHGFCL